MKKNNDTKDRVFIPKTIGESLKKVNKKFSNQFGKIEYLIHSKWLQIVGSFFAKHSEPIKISSSKDNLENKNGTIFLNILYVNVSPAAAVDFQHFKDKITEKINSYFGYQAITGIKILQNFTPKLDENKKLNQFCKTLEQVCIETVESGIMTKDLALCIHGKNMAHSNYVNTETFL